MKTNVRSALYFYFRLVQQKIGFKSVLGFIVLFGSMVTAQTGKPVLPKKVINSTFEELRIDQPTSVYEQIQRVRARAYPGGQLEGNLKVQSVLPTPARKLAPVTELKEDEPREE